MEREEEAYQLLVSDDARVEFDSQDLHEAVEAEYAVAHTELVFRRSVCFLYGGHVPDRAAKYCV